MKKRIKKIIIILLILYGIFTIYKTIKSPFPIGGEYIVSFNNTDKILDKADKELIRDTLFPIQDNVDALNITKLAYTDPFRHEGYFYIFESGAVYEHICLATYLCDEFKVVKKIVDKYYKWWENNEKELNLEGKNVYDI